MTFFIIIRGPAGAGKTSIAKKLASKHKLQYISVDKIKSSLKLKNTEKEKLEANKAVLEEAKKYLTKGENVVIDEVFYYPKQLHELLDKLNYPHYVFSLEVSLKTCLERNKERRKTSTRKMKDKDVIEVHELYSKFPYGIPINNEKQSIEESIKEISTYLQKTMDATL